MNEERQEVNEEQDENENENENENVIYYNRKKHRYEYYEDTVLVAFSAYMDRLIVTYPDAATNMKDKPPSPDLHVIDLDKDW